MTQDEQNAFMQQFVSSRVMNFGYRDLLGFEIVPAEKGVGRVKIAVDERLMHPQMIVHGGVIFTLADTAMSMSLITLYQPGTRVSTIEAKINYLLPVTTGELLAEATTLHQGRSTAVTEATVYNIVNDEKKAIARILGTFAIRPPKAE